MRPIERIDIFLNKIKEDDNLEKVLHEVYKLNVDKDGIKIIQSGYNVIEIFWKENPDWRFSQVLVNTGLLPNYPGFWYYIEDEEVLEKLGLEPRNIYFWGVNFTKDMVRLPKTEWRLIRDLDTDHIEAILDGNWVTRGNKYHKFFIDELKRREDELSTM